MESRAWSGEIREDFRISGAGIVTPRSGDSLRNAEPGSTRHSQPQKSKEREFGRD